MTTRHPVVAALMNRTRDMDITAVAVAAAVGVRRHTVYAWQAGRSSPRFPTAVAWAEHVNLRLAAVDPTRQILAIGDDIPGRFADFRRAAGLTRQQVGARRLVTKESIAFLESGEHVPYLTTVYDHLGALGLRLVVCVPSLSRTPSAFLRVPSRAGRSGVAA